MKSPVYILFIFALLVLQPIKSIADNGGSENTVKREKVISTYEILSFTISRDGMVNWTAKSENGSLPYYVEQYIYDKWVKVGEIDGIGTPTPNSYSVPVSFHTGENKYRVRQKGYDKISRFSDAISYYSKKDAVMYTITNHNQTIEFSSDTYYIIYDPYGVIEKQGNGNSVDISDFSKGYYCLIYDNKLGGFQKKKVLFKNTFYPIEINTPRFLQKRKLK